MSTYASINAMEGDLAHELAVGETIMKRKEGIAAVGVEVSSTNLVSIETTFKSSLLGCVSASTSILVVLHSTPRKVIFSNDSYIEIGVF